MKKKVQKIDFDISGLRSIDSFPLLGDPKDASRLRFPLVGQVVLITSINREKVSSLAPQSWISIFASHPAIVGFGCNLNQPTAKNILSTGEFVVNIPGAELAKKIWNVSELEMEGNKQIEKVGLTPVKSAKLSTPRIAECKAHLECSLDWTKKYGDQVVIFGRVLLASVDKKAVEADLGQRYKYLKLFADLEEGVYGVIKEAKKVSPK
ncbi:MAG: flavin reductase family protein [Candidatus Zixiibacteriota bacterium]